MSLLEEFNGVVERVSATEKKEEQTKEVKENVKEQVKEKVKEKEKVKGGGKEGGKYVSTEWGWKWEGETDEDGYPIERKENDSASMFHIIRNGWYYNEGDKSYKIWDITFKRTGENILAYKKNGELKVVKRVKVPFNLAQRLYETGHAYQQGK